jgi:site-specific DNA-methyltransferase (cytosine-N4-specific)
MLTDEGDFVLDPFAGSSVVGSVCERLNRRWVCCEIEHDYNLGAVGRFEKEAMREQQQLSNLFYKINHPGCLWNENDNSPLPPDGGRVRPAKVQEIQGSSTLDSKPVPAAGEATDG